MNLWRLRSEGSPFVTGYQQSGARQVAGSLGLSSTNSDLAGNEISPARILRSCLIDLGLVSYPRRPVVGVPCFVSSMPAENDTAICIRNTAGRMFGRQARDGKSNTHAGVIVIVRSPDERGYSLANRIAVALDQSMFPIVTQCPEDGSRHWIQNVIRTSPVIALGEETGNKRQLFSIDARIAFQSNEPSLG